MLVCQPLGTHSMRSVKAVRYIPLPEMPWMNRSTAYVSQVGATADAAMLTHVAPAQGGAGDVTATAMVASAETWETWETWENIRSRGRGAGRGDWGVFGVGLVGTGRRGIRVCGQRWEALTEQGEGCGAAAVAVGHPSADADSDESADEVDGSDELQLPLARAHQPPLARNTVNNRADVVGGFAVTLCILDWPRDVGRQKSDHRAEAGQQAQQQNFLPNRPTQSQEKDPVKGRAGSHVMAKTCVVPAGVM